MGNKKGPDETELLAQEHLQKRFEKTIFEPDGNVAPDFLVNDIIAVEVRRLNQNENTTGEMRGLEESSIPLSKGIEKILEKFNDSETDHSWFVGFKFFRPIP